MANYTLSTAAVTDIVQIADYTIRKFGLVQARKYRESLTSTFELLSRHPEIGRDFSQLGPGWRRHPYHDHNIYYKQSSDGILILRLLHSHQDPGRHL
ncbi:type II toxin-antitoxin system RelE/ParE family toxin [Paraglaciecola sp. MB-3u-78]|jgi:toxin ParE1/3/4|uniref:type II toxin-antitoxin system RelE/ParE family toxin n=1 Tax=Paraglaciecola sp. MB-3u-78 TaxID=2058332 RepID=UPI000C345751|nr:type II toxin-antitoxin system RelE/ParE family toxin [Paraglaciecola sp. MB-3u-78]PKH00545.1 hypothetical protein CXF95_03185 [Paraglaciecola sp. MB-3u-78]